MSDRREDLSNRGPIRWLGYRLLTSLTGLACRHPWVVLATGLVVTLLSLGLAWQRLEVHVDMASLLPPNDPYRYLEGEVAREFPHPDDLVVVVARGTAAERETFLESLSAILKQRPDLYQDVLARMDLEFFRKRLLYYLTLSDLRQLAAYLQPAVQWVSHPALSRLSGPEPQNKAILQVVQRMAEDYKATLETRGEEPYVSLWKSAVLEKAPTPELKERLEQLLGPGQYLYNAWPDSDMHVMLVRPTSQVKPALDYLKTVLAKARAGYNVLEIGVTGKPAIAQSELDRARSAARRSVLLSSLLLIVLFRLSLQNRWRPWMMLGSLLVGASWTVGFVTMMVGSLNLLSVTALPVLLALGAGFGINVLYSYEASRARLRDPQVCMEITMQRAGMHSMAAALITAGGFAAIALTGYQALQEFAVVGASGVLLCFLAMVTVLPAWLFLQERYGRETRYHRRWTRQLKDQEKRWLRRPGTTVAVCAMLTLVCLFSLRNMHFDHNLLHLQHRGIQMARVEDQLLADMENVLPAQYLARDVADARRKSARFSRLATVARVDSPVSLLPEDAAKKSTLVGHVADLASQLKVPSQPKMGAVAMLTRVQEVKAMLAAMRTNPAAQVVLEVLEYAERQAYAVGPGPVLDSVQLYLGNVKTDVENALNLLRHQTDVPVDVDQLPESYRSRFVGRTGRVLVSIYPKASLWDYQGRQKFVADLRTVEPNVTGLPVSLQHQTEVLVEAFQRSAVVAGATIILLLLIYFGSTWKTALVMLPQALGLVWTAGLMRWAGVSFNPVNFVGLPMVLAVGGVMGLHVVQRLSASPRGAVLRHPIGAAIGLSGLTSMAICGSLMTSPHDGIASLGFVLTVGVAANMASTLIATPALTRLLARKWGLFYTRRTLSGKPLQLSPTG